MSFRSSSTQIVCDGKGCTRVAIEPMPGAVRRSSGAYSVIRPESKGVEGWLFVLEGTKFRHFCPICTPTALPSITREFNQ